MLGFSCYGRRVQGLYEFTVLWDTQGWPVSGGGARGCAGGRIGVSARRWFTRRGLRALPARRTRLWMAGAGSRGEGPPQARGEGQEQEGQRLLAPPWLWARQEETEHRGDSFIVWGRVASTTCRPLRPPPQDAGPSEEMLGPDLSSRVPSAHAPWQASVLPLCVQATHILPGSKNPCPGETTFASIPSFHRRSSLVAHLCLRPGRGHQLLGSSSTGS